METAIECIPCLIKQGITVGKMNSLSNKKLEDLTREILKILEEEDYSKSPPHLAKFVYKKSNEIIGSNDPYKDIKKFYNNEILKSL